MESREATLQSVIDRCKCGVFLTVNEHRSYYQSAKEFIAELNDHAPSGPEIDAEVAARMIRADIIYELQFYPDTPIGFYKVYGTSLQEVVNKAIEALGTVAGPK